MLHPQLEAIVDELQYALVDTGLIRSLRINSNMTRAIPDSLLPYVYNTSLPRDNAGAHYAALLHPSDFYDGGAQTYDACTYHGKHHVVVNYQGCSVCCVADGYIRLFGLSELIRDRLPQQIDDWRAGMDAVCHHCPFGRVESLPKEREVGAPVSAIYANEIACNKSGRTITKRFPEGESA